MTRILIPSGALGLGYDAEALRRGVANAPDLIAIDGGSTDSGPSYLGRGVSKYARSSTKIEWAGLIHAAREAGCPLVILSPWPEHCWPAHIGDYPELMHWSPQTSAAMIRSQIGEGHCVG